MEKIVWGEDEDNPDLYPENVYVGRVSARNTGEIENWIQKVLNYEQNPGNAMRMKDVLWICQGDNVGSWNFCQDAQ